MPTLSPRLIGMAVAGVALAVLVFFAFHWKGQRDDLRDWQDGVSSATVLAAGLKNKDGSPAKLAPKDVATQIQLLGQALADVRTKTAQARADDAAHARAVEQEQGRISQEVSHEYQAQLTAARARAEQLRRQLSAATDNPGSGRSPPVPSRGAAASRPDAAATQDGLPLEDALIATEQALQLKALQDWNRKQSTIAVATPR